MPAQRTKDTPLEVSTDSPPPAPPALSIIAPTPRAFTFPSAHNLSDSPYSSPSNSPFEPDRRPSLASTCSSIPRSLSPDSTTIPTPPPTQHKRRKSSSDVERRPKKGDEDYVKRPENAFILFRRKCVEDKQAADEAASEGPAKKQRQADLSKMISHQWKSLSPEDRQYWENLAKEKKREHEQLHPDYVYRPQRVKKGKGKKRARGDEDIGRESVQFILPTPSTRQHGRSASAPTPPPYQSFTIPNIFAGAGSCPSSPSLLPLINRRGSGGPEDIMANFDYVPRDTLMPPPSFGSMAHYESNDVMHSMYHHQDPAAAGVNLPPLSMPNDQGMLLPTHGIVSPASSIASTSSGPSSPSSGPFTPTSAMISHSFSRMSAADASSCDGFTQEDLHNQQLYHPESQHDLDLAGYAWDTSSLWGTSTDVMLAEDFDINSIPPIELGVPKFEDHMMMGDQVEFVEGPQPFEVSSYGDSQLSGIVGFDDMMAGNSF